ncbi:MFS transporter [Kitasatospora sp. NPDC049285]|uniref:MFS transporter n=1 Tax=Kitasatospora sp. NPDC049285 TaxID=3157096 RepID=UPI003446CCA2
MRRPGPALAALAAGQFTVLLATSNVNVALPDIAAATALTGTGPTWVVNAYGLAFGALLLPGGRLADRLGRRRVLLAGLALFALASLTAGLANGATPLIAARALQGLGAAAIAPAALALLLDLHPPGPDRGRALAVWGAVSGAGGAAGVLLGGAVAQSWGWPWIFHLTALAAALAFTATALLVPATPSALRTDGTSPSSTPSPAHLPPPAPTPPSSPTPALPSPPARFDLAGAATVTLALTALVWALTTARTSGWTSTPVLTGLAVAALLTGLFARIERRHPDPLLPPRLLRSGTVAVGNLLTALLGSVWIALFYFLPLYQQQVLGAGPLLTGLGQLPLAITMMLGSAAAPRLAARIGDRATLLGALLAAATGLLWLSRLDAHGSYAADLLGPMLLIGLGLSTAFVQLTALSVAGVPARDAGLAGGLANTTRQLGGTLGLAVLATLAGAATAHAAHQPLPEALTAGYRTAFAVSAAVLAATAGLAGALTCRLRTAPTLITRQPAVRKGL